MTEREIAAYYIGTCAGTDNDKEQRDAVRLAIRHGVTLPTFEAVRVECCAMEVENLKLALSREQ